MVQVELLLQPLQLERVNLDRAVPVGPLPHLFAQVVQSYRDQGVRVVHRQMKHLGHLRDPLGRPVQVPPLRPFQAPRGEQVALIQEERVVPQGEQVALIQEVRVVPQGEQVALIQVAREVHQEEQVALIQVARVVPQVPQVE